jgi:hypothetical protein
MPQQKGFRATHTETGMTAVITTGSTTHFIGEFVPQCDKRSIDLPQQAYDSLIKI